MTIPNLFRNISFSYIRVLIDVANFPVFIHLNNIIFLRITNTFILLYLYTLIPCRKRNNIRAPGSQQSAQPPSPTILTPGAQQPAQPPSPAKRRTPPPFGGRIMAKTAPHGCVFVYDCDVVIRWNVFHYNVFIL